MQQSYRVSPGWNKAAIGMKCCDELSATFLCFFFFLITNLFLTKKLLQFCSQWNVIKLFYSLRTLHLQHGGAVLLRIF